MVILDIDPPYLVTLYMSTQADCFLIVYRRTRLRSSGGGSNGDLEFLESIIGRPYKTQ